ncbi:hypothetical protein QQZ08_007086 [Neonectria magnoliae]|uniref:Uncharacterized protein n=1 Tax=Neonectria magnoliae TaxID=2732573 RepID=A0ABR1HZC1_9HYPO
MALPPTFATVSLVSTKDAVKKVFERCARLETSMTQLRAHHNEDVADLAGCDEVMGPKLEPLLEKQLESAARLRETRKAVQGCLKFDARAAELLGTLLPTQPGEGDFAHSVAIRAFSLIMDDPSLPIEMLSHWGEEFAKKLESGIVLRQDASTSQSQLTFQEDIQDLFELERLRNEVSDLGIQVASAKAISEDRLAEVARLNKSLSKAESGLFQAELARDKMSKRKEIYKESYQRACDERVAMEQNLVKVQELADQVPDLKARVKSLEEDLDEGQELQAKSNAELNVELDKALEETRDMKELIKHLQHDAEESRELLADMSAKLKTAKSLITDKDKRILELEGRMTSQKQSHATRHEAINSRCKTLEHENSSLKGKEQAARLEGQLQRRKLHNVTVKSNDLATALQKVTQETREQAAALQKATRESREQLSLIGAIKNELRTQQTASTVAQRELAQQDATARKKAQNRELSLMALFNGLTGVEGSSSGWLKLIGTLDDASPVMDVGSLGETLNTWSLCEAWGSGTIEQCSQTNAHRACLELYGRLSTGTLGSGMEASGLIQATIRSVTSCDRIHRGLCQLLVRAAVSAVTDGRVAANIMVGLPLCQLMSIMVQRWPTITGTCDEILFEAMRSRLVGREADLLASVDSNTVETFCQQDEFSGAIRGQEAYIVLMVELQTALLVRFPDRRMRWISLDRVDSENAAADPYVRVEVPPGEQEMTFSPSAKARAALFNLLLGIT